jgi:hypothetical protein
LCLGFLGCGSTDMTATGEAQSPRAEGCDFDILTATPFTGFKEIGTVDVTPGGYGIDVFTDLSAFKRHIRPQVCRLGGDAAIASANGFGMYIKATVLKRASGAAPVSVGLSTASAAAPMSKSGCEYDAQCKGDRICISGKCEEPASTGTPLPSASPPALPPATSAAH